MPAAPAAGNRETAVRQLPGLPGSASLFVSAMLTVGAWQTVRKGGQLYLAHLPAWYHTGAPQQIGHKVICDPTAGFDLLPVCLFDTPCDVKPVRFGATEHPLPARCKSQYFLTVEAPRGPPSIS